MSWDLIGDYALFLAKFVWYFGILGAALILVYLAIMVAVIALIRYGPRIEEYFGRTSHRRRRP